MGQKKNTELLLQLYNAVTGTNTTLAGIMKNRSIDPGISLIHDTELSGKVPSGSTVPVEKYYTLEDKLDYGSAGRA
ncbi:MAG: hypothetical protein LBB83_11390 [Treponema sp.]|jgi:hypothetical protein|nr:hypothetical protein [Treponema sp.]